MFIYKTSWVILKITKLRENFILLDIFSYDYWKVKFKTKYTKKEKTLDIWYVVNFEITVKKENSINEIKNIKITKEFDYNNKDYEIILEYLTLLKLIYDKSVENNPIYEVFNIVSFLNDDKDITQIKIILSQIKIISIFWTLNIENKNQTIKKILSFISKESIKNILRLTWINEDLKLELKQLIK